MDFPHAPCVRFVFSTGSAADKHLHAYIYITWALININFQERMTYECEKIVLFAFRISMQACDFSLPPQSVVAMK